MESRTYSQIIDELYPIYLEKLEMGEYNIPPLIIISEILQNRYTEENLDLKYDCFDMKDVFNTEDLKTDLCFKTLLFALCLDITVIEDPVSLIQDRDFIQNAFQKKKLLLTAIVKYPEIIIKNSSNHSHTIKDLFFKHTFNSQGGLRYPFSLIRSTYSEEELTTGYSHSHVIKIHFRNSRSRYLEELQQWRSPCLGSDTLLSNLTATLKWKEYKDFDETDIMAYFEAIDAFLHWESLEGGPYTKIENINYSYMESLFPSHKRPYIECAIELVKYLIKDKYFLDQFEIIPTVEKNTEQYDIKMNELFLIHYIVLVSKKLGLFNELAKKGQIVNYRIDDFNTVQYFYDSYKQNLPTIKEYKGSYILTFKEEDILLCIEESVKEDAPKETVDPNILYYIKNYLKNYINGKNGKNKFNNSTL